MNKIEILVVVDGSGTAASGKLQANLYMVDTNRTLGSWEEGTCSLHTVCEDQQLLCWRVVAISADNQVDIISFQGSMIDKKICAPEKEGFNQDIYWEGRVETQGGYGRYAYTMTLSIDGKSFTFSPYIDVQ